MPQSTNQPESPPNQQCILARECLIGFPELFAAAVKKFSDRTAVEFEGKVYTYVEIDRYANQIANLILGTEPQHEQRIGICLDRSHDAIAAMIGIFKSGCAFVPLDPEFPRDRLEMIANDAGIKHIICDANYRELFDHGEFQLIDLNEACADQSTTDPQVSIDPDQLAYIMYTSGSTGVPKGVQIEHAALATYCWADIERYIVTAEDRTLQFSTLNFDIAIEEIFPPLLVGGSVIVRPRERAKGHNELSELVEANNITAIHLATAYWHEWVDLMVASQAKVPSSIRLMIVTGEKVSAEHYRRWNEICDHDVHWCNAYGPTEATVTATVFIPDRDWSGSSMPIGIPLKRYTAKIVDLDKRPVGKDETGELLIGGPALARGYLNRPEQNEKAFIEMTDCLEGDTDKTATRFYRTGDLARWLPNGNIEFAGRIDHQIKLGSYRIEPGEIEAVINQHPQVLESLITFDEVKSKKYLIAYIAQGENKIELTEMVSFIQDKLPPYMVPARFVLVESFPKTINGKIDRKGLPSPAESQIARSGELKAATTELEQELCEIWADVLNIPEIGIDDDFFALGGSSLLVARVVGKLCGKYDIEIPVRDFFANPTIASIGRQIQMLITGTAVPVDNDSSWRHRKKLPIINPHYFQVDENKLFGVHYPPVDKDSNRAVLICPAVGHEYARGHRNLQQLAIMLAQQGCHVLRFDYSGTGNSTGNCEQADPQQWNADVDGAANQLRNLSGLKSITVIGLRLGATIASHAELADIENLISWDPVMSADEHQKQLDQFHDVTLQNYSKFSVVRQRSEIDQAYGYCMTETKRNWFAEFSFNTNSTVSRQFVIASSNYFGSAKPALSRETQLIQTPDEIYWNDQTFAESAFSSPTAFREIKRIVLGDEASNPIGREA
jgi:amino acid adenylation domain-containing protein